MKFILCSDELYAEQYESEAYKHIRIEDIENLVGFKNIHVRLHEGWEDDINDDRIDFLQQQLEALAAFGYIKLIYVDGSGMEERYYPPKDVINDKPSPKQMEMQGTQMTEEQRMKLIEQEDGCAGGACVI